MMGTVKLVIDFELSGISSSICLSVSFKTFFTHSPLSHLIIQYSPCQAGNNGESWNADGLHGPFLITTTINSRITESHIIHCGENRGEDIAHVGSPWMTQEDRACDLFEIIWQLDREQLGGRSWSLTAAVTCLHTARQYSQTPTTIMQWPANYYYYYYFIIIF